jgi:BioD-like phosphotransacetylase family protein
MPTKNMTALYITSTETAAGSTALCAGIGTNLLNQKKKVGFFVPARFSDAKATSSPLTDAAFFKETFQLPEQVEQICPFVLSPRELWEYLTDELPDFTQKLGEAYQNVSQNRDMVVMEGPGNLIKDRVSELACYTIPEILEAKVVIVLRYAANVDIPRLTQICKKLKTRLLGIVINLTPPSRIEETRQHLAAQLQESGIRVLGILPQVRTLLGITVAQLNKTLDGELLTNGNERNELVENIMLGAMSPGSGVDYFGRKGNKAVIVKADRPDMQLAALETSTKCLVLADATRQPVPAVIFTAQEKHIPIILTKKTTSQIITDIEKALEKVSFAHPEKVQKFSSILDSNFDFKAVYAGLGLNTK